MIIIVRAEQYTNFVGGTLFYKELGLSDSENYYHDSRYCGIHNYEYHHDKGFVEISIQKYQMDFLK